MKRVLSAVALAAALVVAAAGCTISNTAPDFRGLHYTGGAFSSTNFVKCQDPGTRVQDGPDDKHYYYPMGQRTFSFTDREGAETPPIAIKTKDSQEMTVKGFVTFELNPDCDTLKRFHEVIGLKYRAFFTEDEMDNGQLSAGWLSFLGDYLAVPLNSTMDRAGLQSGWRTLYTSNDAISAFEDYAAKNLPAEVDRAIGTPGLVTVKQVNIETPQPSPELLDALKKTEVAKAENEAQKQKNEVARTKFQSMQDCKAAGLSENTCLLIKLAEDGSIPFLPIGPGGMVVTPPAAK